MWKEDIAGRGGEGVEGLRPQEGVVGGGRGFSLSPLVTPVD